MEILLVKSKNLHPSACLKLNYGTTKHKPKLQKLLKWWNLSKLVTNALVGLTLVIFQFSPLPPPPPTPLSAEEKISSENAVWEKWVISFCLGDNDKSLGESFAWGMT